MIKKISIVFLLTIFLKTGWSIDTLYQNPNYPPIIYTASEFVFYKYTPKYIPDNLFHSFKILGANDQQIIEKFKSKTKREVLNSGIHYPGARLRKEFCLEGYSDFVIYFHQMGIYYPAAMESFILLSFHQYLNQLKIDWNKNKNEALHNLGQTNRFWKKRKKKLFKRGEIILKESKPTKEQRKKEKKSNPDEIFWNEFGEK